jgi:hypothetical protein
MIVNRFLGEETLTAVGELKTFWRAFQINSVMSSDISYQHDLVAHNDIEDVDGYLELSNTITTNGQVPSVFSAALLRTARADRKLVDYRSTTKRKFLRVKFAFEHVGVCSSFHDVFSGNGDLISIRFDNTSASVTILDETFQVPEYNKYMVSLSPTNAESKSITLELYATNLEYPVVGSRCFTKIDAVLTCGSHIYQVTKQCSLNINQRWQYESRLETAE